MGGNATLTGFGKGFFDLRIDVAVVIGEARTFGGGMAEAPSRYGVRVAVIGRKRERGEIRVGGSIAPGASASSSRLTHATKNQCCAPSRRSATRLARRPCSTTRPAATTPNDATIGRQSVCPTPISV